MDTSPTSLFESYENDFQALINGVREKIDVEAKEQRGEQRKATLRRIEMELDEADEMVSQLEIEIQGMPQSIKPRYQARVKTCKSELAQFKKITKDLHATAARSDLLSSSAAPSDDPYSVSASDRVRLLAGTATLEDSTRRLEDSHRIALETEDVGADILRNLRGQREQIEHARDSLGRADTNIDRASGTLKRMIRRMYQQRYITVAIIVILVVLIAVILWFKLV